MAVGRGGCGGHSRGGGVVVMVANACQETNNEINFPSFFSDNLKNFLTLDWFGSARSLYSF